jgi:hypothetical protein
VRRQELLFRIRRPFTDLDSEWIGLECGDEEKRDSRGGGAFAAAGSWQISKEMFSPSMDNS